ncbi:HPr-rel-A system PqqD family peptide chaperone [Pseudoduganella sp. UC29_71]|jgi:PqqD family protein of HPr-rel-A system|uniref:HPr-rel-A system PqqD family peptide chaperone n=1 Tax=Pseudoduganella sp. UC29_71 TaxID=3350174 RepID=UPI00367181EB
MWRLMPGQRLRSHSWDGEQFVLYNNLSGDTHLLDAAAIEVLNALQPGAADAAALAAALQLDADALPQLDALLADLRALDLVDRAAC